jgi:hypothetical protein
MGVSVKRVAASTRRLTLAHCADCFGCPIVAVRYRVPEPDYVEERRLAEKCMQKWGVFPTLSLAHCCFELIGEER